MKIGRANSPMNRTEVVVLTADPDFASQARQTFGASEQITFRLVSGTLSLLEGSFEPAGATVVVVDLDTSQPEEMQALDRLMTQSALYADVDFTTR